MPLISQYIDEDFRVQHLKKLFLFCEIMVPEQSKKVKKNEEKKKKKLQNVIFGRFNGMYSTSTEDCIGVYSVK